MRDDTTPGAERFPARVAIGLGSNIGDRRSHLARAAAALADLLDDVRFSGVYETDPVGLEDQPPFLNACCVGTTRLAPGALLHELSRLEIALGRVRVGPRFGPRAIDLDILLYGDEVVAGPSLTIPHPRLAERAFALVPLTELAPNWQHPVLGRPLAALADAIGEEGVRRTPEILAPAEPRAEPGPGAPNDAE